MQESAQVPGKREYLAYLLENKLSELDVLPVVPAVDDTTKARVDDLLHLALEAGHGNVVRQFHAAASANTNDLIALMNGSLVRRFAARGIKIPSDVFVGVFPTNSFNAHVVSRPPWQLILINTGTFEFLEATLSIYLSLNPGTARDGAKMLAKLVREYCDEKGYQKNSNYRHPVLDSQRLDAVRHFVTVIEEFAIAHEYGHLAKGHVGNALADIAVNPKLKISVAAKTKEQEFEADRWATNALLTVYSNESEGEGASLVGCSGPLMFLSLENLIEACFQSRGLRFDTHPPAIQRYVELRYALAKAGMNQAAQAAVNFSKFCVLAAQELGVELPEAKSIMLVVDHVGSLVEGGLQDAVPIPQQDGLPIYSEARAPEKKKSRWW